MVPAEDESSIQKISNSPKRGWTKRVRRLTAPLSLSRQRLHIFGVLSSVQFYFVFYEKASTDSFCDFLERVHGRLGEVPIFVGNALYRRSGGAGGTLEKYDGQITPERLLPYTPELNPAEPLC